jgi:OmpA family protein
MRTNARRRRRLLAPSLLAAMLLTGCAIMPTAPMVTVLPGSAKGFDEFRMDDVYCRNYAQSVVAGPSQVATNNAAASAVGGAALGAAAGAIIGSVSGNAGPGAAIGAGTGLLFGSAYGADAYGYSSYALQRQYDGAYVQCMYARGNRVPARVYGGYGESYPPRSYPAPDVPPDYYPRPSPSPGSIPPPNTPPPRM